MINGPEGELIINPTAADIDAGIQKIDDIDIKSCQEWAVKNIDETMKYHKDGWRFLRDA